MSLIEDVVRGNLTEEGRQSTTPAAIRSFCEKVEGPSLGSKVREALEFKMQGHFDKAMLSIAEANRDQVTALKSIQKMLGQIHGTPYPVVVFEKFRQFEPFEIGLSNADEALSFLSSIHEAPRQEIPVNVARLHDLEIEHRDAKTYATFLVERLGGKDCVEEMSQTNETLSNTARELNELRVLILERIFLVISRELEEVPDSLERDRIVLDLAANSFLVVTSSILTKPGHLVETQN